MTEFPAPKYIEDITCRSIWSELVQVLNGPPGTIKIEFCEARWTAEVPVHNDRIVPVARVAMTVGLAQILHERLTSVLENLKQQNELIQAPAASPTKN